MAQKSLKKLSIKGALWSLAENLSTQSLGFVIGIILARLLSPSDYGTVGVLVIFLSVANVFVDCGFATGLIRKADRTEDDLSTAFYFNIFVGVVAYLILFLISPIVASFFKMPILVVLLRVLALCIVFNSISLIQNTILTATLNIKIQAKINVTTQLLMGCLGIYFAYQGFGVWTLVIQQVGSSFLKCIALWIIGGWRPKSKWNEDSFRYLFNYGWKLLGANLIGTTFEQIHGFFIGRSLGAAELGLFTKAKELSSKPSHIITNVIGRVVLPILAEVRGNTDKIRDVYAKMIRLSSFVSFLLFGILFVIARPLIIIIWTEKWLDTANLFQLFCISAAFGGVSQLGLTLLQLLNRTDLTLKFEFIKKPVTLMLLLLALPFGLWMITLSAVVASLFCAIVNIYATKKLLKYGYITQLKDMLPHGLLSLIIGIIIYNTTHLVTSNWLCMIFSTIAYSLSYFFFTYIFRFPVLKDISLLRK